MGLIMEGGWNNEHISIKTDIHFSFVQAENATLSEALVNGNKETQKVGMMFKIIQVYLIRYLDL